MERQDVALRQSERRRQRNELVRGYILRRRSRDDFIHVGHRGDATLKPWHSAAVLEYGDARRVSVEGRDVHQVVHHRVRRDLRHEKVYRRDHCVLALRD